ncbi:hypothetical protein T484DRAFT_1880315 [Baffinella frigidus]|nr:hypothetical protein T484DRAFT_1880315 [Cryptophyta sp. CCMP2293]
MNPEMMKMAQESMANMRPEQMAALQAQMANMDPATMQAQMRAAQNMMSSMSPDQMRSQMAQGPDQHALSRGASAPDADGALKEEGNNLHKAGKYAEAAAKYQAAKKGIDGDMSAAAIKLRESCCLNLASCYLKTGQNSLVVQEAGVVAAVDPTNLKALYRRGQAYAAMGRLSQAKADLASAAKKYPADTHVAAALSEVVSRIEVGEPDVEEPEDEEEEADVVSRIEKGEPDVEEPEDEEEEADVGGGLAALAAAMSKGAEEEEEETAVEELPAVSKDELLAMNLKGLRDMCKARDLDYSDCIDKIDLVQVILDINKKDPTAAVSKAVALFAQEGVWTVILDNNKKEPAAAVILDNKKKDPAAAVSKADALFAQASGAGAVSAGNAGGTSDGQVGMAMKMMQDDSMMKQASSMMSSMSPEALAAMFNARGPGPNGQAWTPEQAKQQAAMMGNPDQIAAARRMMSSMPPDQLKAALAGNPGAAAAMGGMAAGGGMPGGMGGAAGMQAGAMAAKDPAALRQASEMMKTMDPDAMAKMMETQGAGMGMGITPEMAKMSTQMIFGAGMGMGITPEMAKMSAQMMSSMSPEDLSKMMETAQMAKMSAQMMSSMSAEDLSKMMETAQVYFRTPGGGMAMPEITPEMTQQMGSMMKDPAMMKQMTGMMRNMDPAMLKQFGITDPSQLDQAAEQLEKLTPGQLEKLVTWGTRLQGVYIWYKKNAWVKYAGGVTITGLMYYTLGAWSG